MIVGSKTTSITNPEKIKGKYQKAYENWEKNLKTHPLTVERSSFRSIDSLIVSQAVLPSIPCTGLIINTPGYYTLPNDQIYSPCGTNPAITINSSNVTLDLSGYTLSQVDKTVSGIVGVYVQPNVQNITIKNGTVEAFSAVGILIGDFSGSVVNVNVLSVNGYNNGDQSQIYTFFTQVGALSLLNVQNIVIENSNFNTNIGQGLASAFSTNISINNCHFDQNTWCNQQFFIFGPIDPTKNFAFAWGAVAVFSNDIKITNTTFNDTSSQKSSNGIVMAFGARAVIDSCTFQNINVYLDDPAVIASGDHIEVFGIHVEGQVQTTINNCQSHNCGAILNLPWGRELFSVHHYISGFMTFDPNTYTVTNTDCGGQYFVNNTTEPQYCANASFLTFIGDRMYYGNCRARGNNNYDDARSALFVGGWYMAFADTTHIFEDCSSVGHSQYAQNPLDGPQYVFSIASGFHSDTRGSVIYRRCTALNNTDTFDGPNEGIAGGFTTHGHEFPGDRTPIGYVFEDCIAENNTAVNGQGAGFYLVNVVDSQLLNCKAINNDIGILLDDYGTIGPTANNVISDNTLSANNNYGILDKGSLSYTNAYYRNVAKSNGDRAARCHNDSNYSDGTSTLKTIPIRRWKLPQLPKKKDNQCIIDPLDNISINNGFMPN